MIYRFTLMHRDDPVCNLLFDEKGILDKLVRVISHELLPLPAKKDPHLLREWFEDRAVPKTRHNIERLVSARITTGIFMLDNLGLSLTDTYWLKPFEEDLDWKTVNLFDNDFSPAIMKASDRISKIPQKTKFSKFSPDATTKGDLEKKWLIRGDGTRFLVKGNFGIGCQQSLNEKFVTLINKLQDTSIPYTEYDTFEFAFGDDPAICCISDNFIRNDQTEFICGYDIFQSQKILGSRSAFFQLIDGCISLGMDVESIRDFFDYEIMLDYLVTNTDRHLNNFGIIRDSRTLKPLGMAPIYDSGSCLFWSRASTTITDGLFKNIKTHSFCEKEERLLRYVRNYSVINLDRLPSRDAISSLYSEGNVLSEERISFIIRCFEHKVKRIKALQRQ